MEHIFQKKLQAIIKEGISISPYLRRATYLILTFIIAISSCSPSIDSEKTERTIDIDLEKSIRYQPSLLFDSIQLIPLETNHESVFNKCEKLLITDDTYYIWDKRQKSILAFDKKGLFKFNTNIFLGRGPGEYGYLMDFDINPYTNNIEILEPFSRIAVYRPDASFVEYHSFPSDIIPYSGFKIFTEDIYIFDSGFNGYQGNTLLFYSKSSGERIKTAVALPPQLEAFPSYSSFRFYFYNDSLYFTFQNVNHVLKMCPQDLTATNALSFSFSGKTLRQDEIPELGSRNDIPKWREEISNFIDEKSDKYAFVDRIFESKRYCWVFFFYSNDLCFARFNKEDKSTITGYGIFGEKYLLPPPDAFDEKCFYYVSHPTHLPFWIDPKLLDSRSLDIFNSIKEDENPLIIKFYLRGD